MEGIPKKNDKLNKNNNHKDNDLFSKIALLIAVVLTQVARSLPLQRALLVSGEMNC